MQNADNRRPFEADCWRRLPKKTCQIPYCLTFHSMFIQQEEPILVMVWLCISPQTFPSLFNSRRIRHQNIFSKPHCPHLCLWSFHCRDKSVLKTVHLGSKLFSTTGRKLREICDFESRVPVIKMARLISWVVGAGENFWDHWLLFCSYMWCRFTRSNVKKQGFFYDPSEVWNGIICHLCSCCTEQRESLTPVYFLTGWKMSFAKEKRMLCLPRSTVVQCVFVLLNLIWFVL